MACYEDERNISSDSEEYTLHVANLPAELDEVGLRQIFDPYGRIKAQFYRPGASWAYITFGRYHEAEAAIRELHEVIPLHLKVSFARDRGYGNEKVEQASFSFRHTEQPQNHSMKDIALINKPPVQTIGRGKHMDVLRKNDSPRFSKYRYTSESDLDSKVSDPYENPDPYACTNQLWTSGQLTITPDGKRHISCGRGYTKYQIPESDPELSNRINKTYEKRISGLYEYGEDMLESEVGKCRTCSKMTKFTCERCHTFYCSRNCQISDWPQHKTNCEAIPALVPTMRPVPIVQSNKQEQAPIKNMSNIQMPLRRPKRSIDPITSTEIPENVPFVDNIPATSNNDNANISANTYTRNKGAEPATSFKDDANKSPDTSKYLHNKGTERQSKYQKNEAKSPKQNSFGSFEKRAQKDNDVNSSKKGNEMMKFKDTDETLSHFVKSEFLSTVVFTDVKIILKEGNDIWVQKVEKEEELQDMMVELQDYANKAKNAPVIVGKMYIAKYENIWHRVVVTAVNPTRVFYVDYGNEEIAENDDIRKLDKYKDIPRFAAKITLSEKDRIKYKNLQPEDIISVRNVSIDCHKTITVEVKDNQSEISSSNGLSNGPVTPANRSNGEIPVQPKPSTKDTISNVSPKLKNIINFVEVGELGVLQIHAEVKNNTYCATLLPNSLLSDYEKLLDLLPAKCKEIVRNSRYVPRIGDLVCGERPDAVDDWMRGYIVSISPYQISVLDEARVSSIRRAVPCPKEFLDISTFGVVCETTHNLKQMEEVDNQYNFMVVSNKQNKLEIDISDNKQNKCKGTVEPWIPMPDKKGTTYPLESGSEVVLTAYKSHMCLFARSLCTEEEEYYNQVMREVSKYALTAKPLKEPPVLRQMVIARYLDENYYRAIVLKVQEENISVVYIDFGNIEVVNIKDIKDISDELRKMRSCTCKISLKGVPNVPMTKKASDYLNSLVGVDVPLLCTFSGDPFKDGVILKESNKESVNEKIIKLLEPPTPETAEEDKTCYMVEDIEASDLGHIGDTIEAVILYVIEEPYKYALSAYNCNLMTHVFEVMPAMINKYCEESPYYIPRDNEACLALYKGEWFRGGCINRSATPTSSSIFFIDYGNTEFVDHKNIRLMPKDFIIPRALASVCNIVNVAPIDCEGKYSSKVEKRLSELLAPDSIIWIKIVSFDEEKASYDVEIPKIRDILIKEGLVTA